MPSDGWIPGFSFVLIYINLLAGSHQPRACAYKSRLTIASKCFSSGPPPHPTCLTSLPLRHPIQSRHHVTPSTLHPRLHTPHFFPIHLRVACAWGACRAHHTFRNCKHPTSSLAGQHILIIILYIKGTWYYPGSAQLLYSLVNGED